VPQSNVCVKIKASVRLKQCAFISTFPHLRMHSSFVSHLHFAGPFVWNDVEKRL